MSPLLIKEAVLMKPQRLRQQLIQLPALLQLSTFDTFGTQTYKLVSTPYTTSLNNFTVCIYSSKHYMMKTQRFTFE